MSNRVEYVREICKKRNIAISALEKECKFANGYLNPKKLTKIPYERAILIAEYLNIPVDSILNDPDEEKAPTLSDERQDILDEVDVAFYGDYKELTEDDKETLRAMARVMRERRAKKQE